MVANQMIFEDDIVPHYECTHVIGKDQFSFYFPVEIGDFVVYLWTRSKKLHDFSAVFAKAKENGALKLPSPSNSIRYPRYNYR
jgi:hypothetical protein